jgi:hypothetical protein
MPEERGPDARILRELEDADVGRHANALDRYGARIATAINATEKAVQTFALSNATVGRVLEELAVALTSFGDQFQAGARVEFRGGMLLLSGTPVRLGYKAYKRARELMASMRARGVAALVFPRVASRQQLQGFFTLYLPMTSVTDAGAVGVLSRMEAACGVHVEPAGARVHSTVSIGRDRTTVRLYAVLQVLIRDALEDARTGQTGSLVPLKRALQLLAEVVTGREALLLALMDVPELGGTLEGHVANVTTLSLIFARRLGLPPTTLLEVGLAAVFHDLGRGLLPAEVQGRMALGEPLPPEERRLVAVGPFRAARHLLDTPAGRAREGLPRVVVAFENQAEFTRPDLYRSGVPQSLASRLIALPNAYDSLLRPLEDRQPHLPAEAIRWMLEDGEGLFDPDLLHLFVRMLGLFPSGSLVELNTGEQAVVVSQQENAGTLGQPWVDVLTDPQGCPIEPFTVDLSVDQGRAIRMPLDPLEMGFDLVQYLLKG